MSILRKLTVPFFALVACAVLLSARAGTSTACASDIDEKKAEELSKKATEFMDGGDFLKGIQCLQFLAKKQASTAKGKQAQEMLKPGGVLHFKKLQVTGPESARIDVVFVGEGYTAILEKQGKGPQDQNGDGIISENDQSLFCDDVQLALKIMKADSPFKEYWNYFNFYRLNVVSAQTGCDVPERKVSRDTPFDAKFENNVMSVDWDKVAAVVEKFIKPDYTIVLVQRGEKGSSVMARNAAVVGLRGSPPAAGTPDKTWGPEWGLQSLMHELGHSIGKCGDEYFVESPFGPPPEKEPDFPNVTRETDREKIKWKHWIEPATAIPTPGGDQAGGPIGLFEGALSMKKGFYRPYGWCCMRGRAVGGENPYCPVCREAILLQMHRFVNIISAAQPAEEEQVIFEKAPLSFEADVLLPANGEVKIEFVLEGDESLPEKESSVVTAVQAKKLKKEIYRAVRRIEPGKLKPAKYTLTLTCSDLTPFVREDPKGMLKSKHVWKFAILNTEEMSEEEIMAAKGLVRHEDKWIPKEEKRRLDLARHRKEKWAECEKLNAEDRKKDGQLDRTKWENAFEFHTPRYNMKSDISRELIESVGKHMQETWEVYAEQIPVLPPDEEKLPSLPVLMFREEETFRRITAQPNATGVYAFKDIEIFFAKPNDPWGRDSLLLTLDHEACHYYLDMAIPGELPRWVDEGLSLYFSVARMTNLDYRKEYPGEILTPVRDALNGKGKFYGIQEVFEFAQEGYSLGTGQNDDERRTDRRVHYGESLTLCSFLLREAANEKSSYSLILKRALGALANGKSPSDADKLGFEGVSLLDFEADWKKYIEQVRLEDIVPPTGVAKQK